MWGTDINNIHAVGGEGTYRFYDGKQFQRRDELTNEEVSLYGVWGAAADDVYIAGSHGTILHFDGNEEDECLLFLKLSRYDKSQV